VAVVAVLAALVYIVAHLADPAAVEIHLGQAHNPVKILEIPP
jgi:hypothetical protein